MALKKFISLSVSFALFFSVVLWGCGGEDDGVKPADTTGQIQGTVRDAATGEIIPQVLITTVPVSQSVITKADGTFLINEVIPTQYSVTAMKDGYSSETIAVQVVAGAIAKADFLLKNVNGEFEGDSLNVIEFDGIDDYGIILDHADFNLSGGSFSVEAIVYPYDLQSNGWQWIVNHGTSNSDLDYLLGFENGRPFFGIRSIANILKSGPKLETNTWYHIAGVVDNESKSVRLYINGVLIETVPLKGSIVNTSADMLIGARQSDGKKTEFFKGIIREVRLWNRVRSTTELQQTMNSLLNGKENGLVGYWRINEGTGLILQDYSIPDRAGSLMGDPLWMRTANPWN